ncbi:hypothetical protein NDU88_006492 [Pleurodeles waltl]|uniref:Uncharacterized protein n=1 Tax=Pleurodeles waltl TaxID=8319 RepID=A0AAV7TZN3_PLEWA|nr:hypothetical protein NDU88_006492 [Pleurodeles waltl]
MSSGGSHMSSAIRGVRSGPPVNGEREELDPLCSELLSLSSPYRLSCSSGAAVPDHDVLLEVPGASLVVAHTLRARAPLLLPRPSAASISPRPSGRHVASA